MQLTIRDASRYLGVSEDTLNRWIERGDLPAIRVNDQYRFNRVELLEWAAQRKIPVAAEILEEPGEHPGAHLRLSDAIRAGGVHGQIPGSDAATILRRVVDVLPVPASIDRGFLYEMLLAREKLGSTSLGNGIAIPHPRDPLVMRIAHPLVSVCYLAEPTLLDAPDNEPVHTLFVMITPNVKIHLHLLAALATVLRDESIPPLLRSRVDLDTLVAEIERLETVHALSRTAALARSDRP